MGKHSVSQCVPECGCEVCDVWATFVTDYRHIYYRLEAMHELIQMGVWDLDVPDAYYKFRSGAYQRPAIWDEASAPWSYEKALEWKRDGNDGRQLLS